MSVCETSVAVLGSSVDTVTCSMANHLADPVIMRRMCVAGWFRFNTMHRRMNSLSTYTTNRVSCLLCGRGLLTSGTG